MFCLPKVLVRSVARSKNGNELLLPKEIIPDYRILLVGRKNSGKTTFLKQARQKYGKGFSDSEYMEYKDQIIQKIYKIVAKLVEMMKEEKLKIEIDLEGKEVSEIIKQSECRFFNEVNPSKHSEVIKQIWKDARVKQCYANCTKSDILRNGEYFLNNLTRILSTNYIPSLQDIMQIETPTNCTNSKLFNISGLKFEVVDTPGCEKGELEIGKLTNFNFVIYFISLDEFRSAKTCNELQELSENIANIRTLIESLENAPPVLIYFTQTQEYFQAQKTSHTAKNPDYVEVAKKRILRNFSRFIDSIPNQIYHYFEDTNKLCNMKLVYELMKHEAVKNNLKQINCPLC